MRVHYTGTLEDGRVFDSSQGREPLEFTVGSGQVIPGFDQGVAGMQPGEQRTLEIDSGSAYGARRDDLVLRVPREQVPPDIEPQVGQQLQMSTGENTFVVTVTEVAGDALTLDANHPLAGEDLRFQVELVDIV